MTRHKSATSAASAALKTAIELADVDLYKRVIQDGVDVSVGFSGTQACTPLLHALHMPYPNNHPPLIEIMESLAVEGAAIVGKFCGSSQTSDCTAFHFAASYGYVQLLRILLDKHPTAMLELPMRIHPIQFAVLEGNVECVQMIIDHQRQYGKISLA